MKWMVRVDMEGVSGVVNMEQVVPGASGYAFGYRMLQRDLQALLDGLLCHEDDEAVLYDIHFDGNNVELEQLDPRVRVIRGKPLYTVENNTFIEPNCAGMIMLGLHARAGMPSLLAHNYEHEIERIEVSGADQRLVVGEIGLEALMAGEAGVPLVMATGDSAGMDEAKALLPDVLTVTVKESLGQTSALCYPISRTSALIRDAARQCAIAANRLRPFTVTGPVELTMRFAPGALLNKLHARLPDHFTHWNILRLDGRTVVEAWAKYLEAKTG